MGDTEKKYRFRNIDMYSENFDISTRVQNRMKKYRSRSIDTIDTFSGGDKVE